MIKHILLLIIAFPFILSSQNKYCADSLDIKYPLTFSNNRATLTGVMTYDSLSSDKLYSEIEIWFSKSFKNSRVTLEHRSRESKSFFGSSSLLTDYKYVVGYTGLWTFDIEILVKEGRMKYIISNIVQNNIDLRSSKLHDANLGYAFELPKAPGGFLDKKHNQKTWDETKAKCICTLQTMIDSLDLHIKGNNSDSDW